MSPLCLSSGTPTAFGFIAFVLFSLSGAFGAELSVLAIANQAGVGFTPDLVALLKNAQCGPIFEAYLKDIDVRDILDLALLASSHDTFAKVCVDADVADKPREVVKARKVWALAGELRDQRTASAGAFQGAVAVDERDDGPLGLGIPESLRDGFKTAYNFHLSGSRLLSDSPFNSTYRGLHRQPKRLKVVLLENVKSMSSLNTGDDLSGVLMSARGGVHNVKVSHSAVGTAHEMWIRIRIVMTSICYIMLGHPGFLSWETVEGLMEYLNELIFHRLDGQRPDIMFFNRAYLLTMNHWSNELRVTDCKLEGLIVARTGWSHFWTNYQPSMRLATEADSSATLSGTYDMSMLPADIVDRIDQVQSLTKQLQSQVDRQAADINHKKRPAVEAIEDGAAPASDGRLSKKARAAARKGAMPWSKRQ